jgi:hypothetical protein
MDMSLVTVDVFEPLWARAAGLLGLLIASIALALLVASAIRRRNVAPRRFYVFLGALIIIGVISSAAYHIFVRLPRVSEYERRQSSSHVVRQAANRQLDLQLVLSGTAMVLVFSAAAVPRRANASPN